MNRVFEIRECPSCGQRLWYCCHVLITRLLAIGLSATLVAAITCLTFKAIALALLNAALFAANLMLGMQRTRLRVCPACHASLD